MAIILLEEVLMGLDDVKDSLTQAVMTLEALVEDMHPELGEDLRETVAENLLSPIQSRVTLLEQLLDDVASRI